MREIEKILKALSNKRRVYILKILDKQGTASVGDIASEIKLSFKSTSKHLAVLSAAEIVEKEQVNLTMMYSIKKPQHILVRTTLSLV
jgi:DNA-binding transcriptional ArsR family regulator